MPPSTATFRLELNLPDLRPEAAFDLFVSELATSLPQVELRLGTGPMGWLYETLPDGGEREIARVTGWERGRRIAFAWSPVPAELPHRPVEVVCGFEAVGTATRVTIEYGPWPESTPIGDANGRMAWFASRILAPIFRATGPSAFGGWWTDRVARRPTGPDSRKTYADPLFHRPNFLLILERLKLGPGDRLLEVGCGGGAFLKLALASGCRAWAVDHSPEMVQLARASNPAALDEKRLDVREADAAHLPFEDRSCTCAVTTGSFAFWERPVEGLEEIRRVLQPGGRLLLFTGTKELRGTPAAPEPVASHVHWYEDDELANVAREAGFVEVRVERPAMGRFARESGLPDEVVAFFETGPPSGQLLEARRPKEPGQVRPPKPPPRRRRRT
jgi:SAM-dependent methyltransferase